MGWRAIRIGLDRPAMLRQQLRALIRAARGRTLHVKFPMVAEVAELERARALVDMELARAVEKDDRSPRRSRSASCSKSRLCCGNCRHCASASISCRLAPMICCNFCLPVTAAIPAWPIATIRCRRRCCRYCAQSSRVAHRWNVPQHVRRRRGQSARGDGADRSGFRTLSMSATAIGPVKTMIRTLDARAVAGYLKEIGDRPDHSLRPKLEAYARDHEIAL